MDKAWEFAMAQNMADAYDFDDVFISLPTLKKTFCIQLKHKDNPKTNRISLSQLESPSGDFSLFKYLKSYCQIKQHYTQKLSDLGKFVDFVLVIYTNIDFNKSVKPRKATLDAEYQKFLSTGGVAHSFDADHFQEITYLLQNGRAYMLLLQKAIVSVSQLTQDEEERLLEFMRKIKKSNAKEIPNKEELEKELKRVASHFEVADTDNVKQSLKVTPEIFEGFLKQLVFFSKQSSEREVENFVLQEMEQIYKKKFSDFSKAEIMRREFQKLAERKYFILPTARFWSEVVVQPWIADVSREILEQLESLLKVTFNDEEYKRMIAAGDNVEVVRADEGGTLLTILKIHDGLKEPHILLKWESFLQRQEEVLSLWGRWCDVLVLEVARDAGNAVKYMEDVVKDQRRVIIVTECDWDAATVDDTGSMWQYISKDSQQELQKVKMLVQGKSTTFGEAVGPDDQKWGHLMKPGFVLQLMKSKTPIELGSELKHPDNYISHPLQRHVTLSDSVLHSSSERFGITGISKKEFHKRFSVGFTSDRFAMMTSGKQFEDLAHKYNDQNVHGLHYNGEALVWKQTIGDMCELVKHVDMNPATTETYNPEHILSEQRVLLTAESGMGKSTFLSQMAAEMKRREGGTIWVAKVNLEDHRLTFSSSADVPKYVDVILAAENLSNNSFASVFLQMMLNAGRVAVLMDSFDEVAHIAGVMDVLSNFLKKTDIKLWVASRPISGGKLETLFQMLPYSLPYFTLADQQDYLLRKWRHMDLDQVLVKKFIDNILRSVSMEPFGVPLLLLIISETFQEELKTFVTNGTVFTLPETFDDAFLHRKYISKKLEIYCERNKVSARIVEENYMEQHMLVSLNEIFDVRHLDNKYLTTKIASLNKDTIQNMGIIHISASGKCSFLHRSFAEYFVALWFKTYHSSCTAYLRDHLFKQEFQSVRKFLDCLLTEGFALHTAIRKKSKDVPTPRSEDEVNTEDVGGRTPLHLLVTVYKDEMYFGSRENCETVAEQLLQGGADPNKKDQLLDWSSVEYAVEAETWPLLELMLQHGAHSSCLTRIADKLEDQQTRDTLLYSVANRSFINLLEHVLKYANVNEYLGCFPGSQLTMLHVAVEAGNMDVVKKLMDAGAKVNLHMLVKRRNTSSMFHYVSAKVDNPVILGYVLQNYSSLETTGELPRVHVEEAAVENRALTIGPRPESTAPPQSLLSPVVHHQARNTSC